MDILFLDDMETRHQSFKRIIHPHHDVTYVYTADAAKKAMLTTAFELAFLDHDLAEEHYGADNTQTADTGQEVAQFIADKVWSQFRPPVVIIHSMNPDGSIRMEAILKSVKPAIEVHRLVFGSQSFIRTVQGLK